MDKSLTNSDIAKMKMAVAFDEITRSNDSSFDMLSDVDILKSFNIAPNTQDSEIYEGSLVSLLLKNRNKRPSKNTWNALCELAKSNGLYVADAANLYFYIKDQYPMRNDIQPDDAPPNITGDAAGGFGLMGDNKKEKDCD